MFKLHVVQAKYGDALLLSFGTAAKPRHIPDRRRPSGNYAADLEPALEAIVGKGKQLDLAVLSHVDNDHVIGLLDLFAAVEDDQVSGRALRTRIAGLWHNSFERTIDRSGKVGQQMQANMMMLARMNTPLSADTLETFYGIKEGNRLRLMAKKLGVPVNKGFKSDVLLAARDSRQVRAARIADSGPEQGPTGDVGNRVARVARGGRRENRQGCRDRRDVRQKHSESQQHRAAGEMRRQKHPAHRRRKRRLRHRRPQDRRAAQERQAACRRAQGTAPWQQSKHHCCLSSTRSRPIPMSSRPTVVTAIRNSIR